MSSTGAGSTGVAGARAGRLCDHCSRPLKPQPSAPAKRFCSAGCRQDWHLEKRKRAMELLRKLEEQGQGHE